MLELDIIDADEERSLECARPMATKRRSRAVGEVTPALAHDEV
jgi:hypothetical protein